MKNLPIEFQKITVDKKGYYIEIKFHDIFNTVNNIFPGIILSFQRPKFDEKSIRSDIAHKWASKFAEGLFTEEMKKKMDEEADAAVQQALIAHETLPHNCVLPADLIEFKYAKRILKVSIGKKALEYFISNVGSMSMMTMSIDQIFIYSNDLDKTKKNANETINTIAEDLLQNDPTAVIYLED